MSCIFTALGALQRATLAARARTGDECVSTSVKAGKFRVERVIYRGSHAHVEHLSEPLPMEEAIRFLDSYGGMRGGAR